MCADGRPAQTLLHDVEPPFEIELETVDAVTVTTVMDNVSDVFMPDQGPAKRFGPGNVAEHVRPAATMESGDVFEVPLAEHGFSALVEVAIGDRRHRSCSTQAPAPTAWSRTCASWASTPRLSKPSFAAMATSTIRRG